MSDKKRATLQLENGREFHGFALGEARSVTGEVVFNTAMMGYPESLTDPSYSGQILVLTYPLIGNYGVPSDEMEHGLRKFFESEKIHVRALVMTDYSFEYSHWNAVRSLDEWLKENGIPAIYGVDTREITKTIRESGVMLGKLIVQGSHTPAEFEDPNVENLVAKTSSKAPMEYGDGEHTVVLIDCGLKSNIIRCLLKRGARVITVPWDYDFSHIPYDGLMISNGPGDPRMCGVTVENVKKAMNSGKPIFGICMGNQILSMAAGGSIYKMKYGHRGHNQPALMVGSQRAFITSQNHGYAVDASTLDSDWEPYFTNLNDGSIEGVRHKTKPFCSVQFHPEATSGPVDTSFLFDNFIENIAKCKAGKK